MRYKLLIEYDGTPYAGWQRQRGLKTVQGAIEDAIFAFSAETVGLIVAGRTDAGVHAYGQVAHVDLEKNMQPYQIRAAINAYLAQAGEAIAILTVEPCAADFNARFCALRRHYRYFISNRPALCALNRFRHWWVPQPLDVRAMQAAAQCLIGKHDFTTFRSAHCQAKNPVRTMECVRIERSGDLIEIYLVARAFLHNQVRSIVGSLVEVGSQRWQVEDMQIALEACDRSFCGRVAPAHGLYFERVDYP